MFDEGMTDEIGVNPFEANEPSFEGEIRPDRAIAANARFARSLGWQPHYDRIARFLGFTTMTPDARTFAEGVANYQLRLGLAPSDGIIGPVTWARLRRSLWPSKVIARTGAELRNNVVRIALGEWVRWGRGTIKEHDTRMHPVLQDYWKLGAGIERTDSSWWSKYPWSAAFISWVMRKAGAGSAFRYSGGHSYYIHDAKLNRLANNLNPFKTYRISEAAPRPGDLVCKSRAGSGADYDNIRPGMLTHCDIVTAIEPSRIATVGGNVGNSVSMTSVQINLGGLVVSAGYFAVIRTGT